MTGNPAARSRARALDSSRAAISASTRVRSTSSGAQRWVLAVCSTSGAMARTVASFSRFSPATRSAAQRRGLGGGHAERLEPIGVERPGRHRRQVERRAASPCVDDVGDAGAGFEDRADVAGLEPPERDGPLERGDQRVAAPGGFEGDDQRRARCRAWWSRPRRRRGGTLSAVGPSARNALSAPDRGRTARAGPRRGPP